MQQPFHADYEGVMSVPRYRPVVLAAACALALAAPASAAYAATAQHAAAKPVLTIGKKGGPAVKKRAVLKASLPKGKSATFALTTSAGSFTATCKSSTLQAKVTANSSSKATLSLTGLTIRHCKLHGAPAGVSLTSVKALNLPYGVTIRSASGFPVTISGSKAKPLSLQASVSVGTNTYTCVATARRATGHASNSGNKISAAKQKFTLDAGKSSPQCAQLGVSSVTFSATYGPVQDTSVNHSPKVFFN
jgi:hypothetical protein